MPDNVIGWKYDFSHLFCVNNSYDRNVRLNNRCILYTVVHDNLSTLKLKLNDSLRQDPISRLFNLQR